MLINKDIFSKNCNILFILYNLDPDNFHWHLAENTAI